MLKRVISKVGVFVNTPPNRSMLVLSFGAGMSWVAIWLLMPSDAQIVIVCRDNGAIACALLKVIHAVALLNFVLGVVAAAIGWNSYLSGAPLARSRGFDFVLWAAIAGIMVVCALALVRWILTNL